VENGNSMMGCNTLADEVCRQYYIFMSRLITGASLASSLVHIHYDPCGSASIMLSEIRVSPTSGTGIPVGPSFVTYPMTLVYQDLGINGVHSSIQLSASELVSVMLYSYTRTANYAAGLTAQSNYLFGVKLTNGMSFNAFIRNAVQQTFSPESGFSKSLAVHESDFDPQVASTNIVDIYATGVEDCFWKGLLKATFQALSPAIKIGSGLLCKAITLPIGPVTSQVAGEVCSAGAEKLTNFIISRLGIRSNDIVPTNSQVVRKNPSAKQVNQAVSKVVDEGMKTVKAKNAKHH